jgi:hypothetical protein
MPAKDFSRRVKQSGYMLFRAADLACYPIILISMLVENGPRLLTFCSPRDIDSSPVTQLLVGGAMVIGAWEGCPLNQVGYSPWKSRYEFYGRYGERAMDPGNIVSGLYGPGVQVAWLLTTLSVMATIMFVKSPNENDNDSKRGINADLIASVLFTVFASADLLHKSFFPKEFFKYTLQFDAAAQTVWTAIVLLLAILAPFRTSKRVIEVWQVVFYSTLWIGILSYLLSRQWLLFDLRIFLPIRSGGTMPEFIPFFKTWVGQSDTIFRFLLSIPMILYFSFASKLRSIIWKGVIMLGFILFYTVIFEVLLELHHRIFFPYPIKTTVGPPNDFVDLYTQYQIRPEYFLKVLRKVVPVTSHSLTDLDQMLALVTTAVILAWQWNVWRFPITLAAKIKETLTPRISPGRPSAEEPAIDLESLSPRRTGVEGEV